MKHKWLKALILFSIILSLIGICLQTNIHAEIPKVFQVHEGKVIHHEQLIKDLKKTNLVFVGEIHDRESHHQLQLDVIKALHTLNIPIAIGFEMFKAESQHDLDKWVAGLLPLENFTDVYYKNWSLPWPLYKDILLYARDNKIPVIGLNIPPEISKKVASSGFPSLTKEELEKLPPETGCAVDEKYMRFIRRAYSMHRHGNKQFLHFCEAQLLWDQVMARNLAAFLKKNPDKIIVVITGNGHAWKRGIPEQIRALSGGIRYKVILPEIPGYIDPQNITIEDADYILSGWR
jgi:uncharacterized iron-regulated protein